MIEQGKCLIISGGELENPLFYQELVSQMQYIIAVDGGARHAKIMGLEPHLIVGDFDTITPEEVESYRDKGITLEHYPPEKDFSDTHLALLKAIDLGFSDITIIAALGGRIDYSLANIMLLALPEARNANVRILTEYQEIFLVGNRTRLKGKPGTIVSLLPLSQEVSGITTDGLMYQVPQQRFVMGTPNGISNVMTKEKAYVQVEEGLLLAIITHSEGE